MHRYILLVVLTLVVSACAARRPYSAPVVEPAGLSAADAAVVTSQPFDARWWTQFEDAVLDTAITRALAANHDVRIAVARVEQARAFADEVHRDRYPTVGVGAAVDRRDQAIPGFSNEPRAVTTYS